MTNAQPAYGSSYGFSYGLTLENSLYDPSRDFSHKSSLGSSYDFLHESARDSSYAFSRDFSQAPSSSRTYGSSMRGRTYGVPSSSRTYGASMHGQTYGTAAYDIAPAPDTQPSVRVVRGTGAAQTALSPSLVTLARLAAVVLVVIAVVCCVRIGLASATVTTMIESDNLAASIDDARSYGSSLEVQKNALSSTATIKSKATKLDMARPESVSVITLSDDVVVTDAQGNLSLSGSVRATTEAEG